MKSESLITDLRINHDPVNEFPAYVMVGHLELGHDVNTCHLCLSALLKHYAVFVYMCTKCEFCEKSRRIFALFKSIFLRNRSLSNSR